MDLGLNRQRKMTIYRGVENVNSLSDRGCSTQSVKVAHSDINSICSYFIQTAAAFSCVYDQL